MPFPPTITILAAISVVLLIGSVALFFGFQKSITAIIVLLFSNFCLSIAFALLDPFLNLWDEQFHALVAKNMMGHPFKPMLYAYPFWEEAMLDWATGHIWLHKQPLFLWQMALSMKIFGVSVFWMRFPSILMHVAVAFFIYRIGKIAVNEKVAFMAAAIFSFANYPLEVVAGLHHTDHNDAAFLFYVSASLWAWFEYQHTGKRYWLVMIGLFSGGAVLVKWLVGLLVFAGWGTSIALTGKWKQFKELFLSSLIAFATFLPWQIYILIAFPVVARREYALSSSHFFEVVEGHGGSVFYHWHALEQLYAPGDAIPYILLVGLILLVIGIKDKSQKVFVATSVLVVYLFFTMASTKMPMFTWIVSPFLFLGLALLIEKVFAFVSKSTKQKYLSSLLQPIALVLICIAILGIETTERQHTLSYPKYNNKRLENLNELKFIESIDLPLPDEKYVIFNANLSDYGAIPFMFHRDFAVAYDFMPDQDLIRIVQENGLIPVYIIRTADGSPTIEIPD